MLLLTLLACELRVLFPVDTGAPDTGLHNPVDSWVDTGSVELEGLHLSTTEQPSLDWDLPTELVGCSQQLWVWVDNTSSETVEILDLAPTTASSEFDVDPTVLEPLPWLLYPGDTGGLSVQYAPIDEGPDRLRLEFTAQGAGSDRLLLELGAVGEYLRQLSEPFLLSAQSDPQRLPLQVAAVPKSLVVTVDGERILSGFTYDEADQSVLLAESYPGSTVVEVSYAEQPPC
ncbi:MAG: hypothetical protein VX899_12260 [Myxococcota bacterium]|nr:hypothetical protein [Myxococcota bacterium]